MKLERCLKGIYLTWSISDWEYNIPHSKKSIDTRCLSIDFHSWLWGNRSYYYDGQPFRIFGFGFFSLALCDQWDWEEM